MWCLYTLFATEDKETRSADYYNWHTARIPKFFKHCSLESEAGPAFRALHAGPHAALRSIQLELLEKKKKKSHPSNTSWVELQSSAWD